MFEEIVESKFRPLRSTTEKMRTISLEEVAKSELPLYAVKFVSAEQIEISTREQLNALLEKSVKLIVNYSLRPKWTLINYLFGSYDSKPADEILKKAEVFGFYKYYVDLISSHIRENSMMFIAQDEVSGLIDDANKVVLDKLVKDTSSIKIKNFFSQIYKLKYGDDREVNLDWSIPFLFIKLFLEDKNFQELLDKFRVIPGLDDSMEIEMKTSIKVLTDKYYVNDDFFVLKEKPTAEKKAEKIPEVKQEKKEQVKEQETHGVIDLTNEIKPEPAEKPAPEKSKITIEEEEPKGIIRIIKNIPTKRFGREKKIKEETKEVIKEEEIIPEKAAEEKAPEQVKQEPHYNNDNISGEYKIKHLFKQEELNTIAKKVFKGSKSSMNDAFEELERFKTWQDASEYLKDLFLKNKVDLYNKQVVLFVDLLNDHFVFSEKGK